MAIQEFMQAWIDGVRRDVETVDGLTVQILYRNTEGNLQNIRGYLQSPQELDDDLSAVLKNTLTFASVYGQNWQIGDAGLPRIAAARTAVLDAIDALETSLQHAKLSGRKNILGT